jgi:hypothetical protein
MTQKEQDKYEQYLLPYYQSLHMTVIYEDNFLENLGGSRIKLFAYRDDLLDKINDVRRILGRIK